MYKIGDIGYFKNRPNGISYKITGLILERSDPNKTYVELLNLETNWKATYYIETNTKAPWHFHVTNQKRHNHPLTNIFK